MIEITTRPWLDSDEEVLHKINNLKKRLEEAGKFKALVQEFQNYMDFLTNWDDSLEDIDDDELEKVKKKFSKKITAILKNLPDFSEEDGYYARHVYNAYKPQSSNDTTNT